MKTKQPNTHSKRLTVILLVETILLVCILLVSLFSFFRQKARNAELVGQMTIPVGRYVDSSWKGMTAAVSWQKEVNELKGKKRVTQQKFLHYWFDIDTIVTYTAEGEPVEIFAIDFVSHYANMMRAFDAWAEAPDGIMGVFPAVDETEDPVRALKYIWAQEVYSTFEKQWSEPGEEMSVTQRFFLYGESDDVKIEDTNFQEFISIANDFDDEITVTVGEYNSQNSTHYQLKPLKVEMDSFEAA